MRKLVGLLLLNPLTEKLLDKLSGEFEDTYVTQAMRYTPPFAQKCVEQIRQEGIEEVVLLPLYPQYSTTTTKSSVEDFLEAAHNHFSVKVIDPFYENTVI